MKKLLTLSLAALLALSLTACGGKTEAPAEPMELTVFAAASLNEAMDEIIATYKTVAPNVNIVATYDSSGTLKKQIESGATCDLFLSASPKQMNQLDAGCDTEKNPDKLDFVDSATRINLLENKVTLAVPQGNPKGVTGFAQLSELLKSGDILLAMGNSDVPVGQYTQKILTFYGLDEAALANSGVLTYGSNVKEVTSQVKEASVDCGVIYATDAFSAGLTVVDTATKEQCGQVIYPAAVLKGSANAQAAQAFLTYLSGSDAMAIFEAVGFSAAK